MTTVLQACGPIAEICDVSESKVYKHAMALMRSGHLPKNSGRRYHHIGLAEVHHIIAAVIFARNVGEAESASEADAFSGRIDAFKECVRAESEYRLMRQLGKDCARGFEITTSGMRKLKRIFGEELEIAT